MDFDQLYPNRFLKAGEFQGRDVTLKISGVVVEELENEKGKKGKGLVSFERTPKQLVLNRTNGEAIKLMFGRETNAWIGKRVTLFPATITDSFTGEPTLAIRVRGSPDIDGPKSASAKIGRKTVPIKVTRTGQQQKPAAKAAPAAPPPPPPEPDADEPPPFGEPPPDFDPVTGEVAQ